MDLKKKQGPGWKDTSGMKLKGWTKPANGNQKSRKPSLYQTIGFKSKSAIRNKEVHYVL